LLTYSFGVIKWSKTNLRNINIQTRVLFTKFCKHHPKSAIEIFNLPRENGGRGFSNLEILQRNQIGKIAVPPGGGGIVEYCRHSLQIYYKKHSGRIRVTKKILQPLNYSPRHPKHSKTNSQLEPYRAPYNFSAS
jgi:hypothetical protein